MQGDLSPEKGRFLELKLPEISGGGNFLWGKKRESTSSSQDIAYL